MDLILFFLARSAKFPEVVQVSTDTLATWLNDTGKSKRPVLLDVREREEYQISHLEDAVPALSREQALKALEGSSPDQPVVLYCSLGYRSSEMAESLAKKGLGTSTTWKARFSPGQTRAGRSTVGTSRWKSSIPTTGSGASC